jgi:hypothetical protein
VCLSNSTCASYTGEGSKLDSPKDGGCISFEAKGATDITVILKSKKTNGQRATKRLDHWSGGVSGGGGDADNVADTAGLFECSVTHSSKAPGFDHP